MEVNILVFFLIEKNEDSKEAIIKQQAWLLLGGFGGIEQTFVCKSCISSLTTPHSLNLTS